ncbi:hypothetical protein [Nocardia sp. NPDC057030]|uniref:hypothetical protein n=1 Tax=unclassified Nocardia TaxID=2637762 RepID=UPI0036423025
MNYPQYPGGYNPYPGYSTGMPAPSGATAITAGVLACVGAVGQLLGGGISLAFGLIGWQLDEYDTTGLFAEDWFQTWAIASGAISLVVAIVLGVGAIGMFSRKSFGRLLVVVGCVGVIVAEIVGFAIVRSFDGTDSFSGTLSGGASGLFGLIFPIATAVLALLPMTSRWLAHTPVATMPQQYGYPYPGPQVWPQPPVDQVNGQQPQGPWGQPAPGVPQAGQTPWQQSPPQAAWGQPAPGGSQLDQAGSAGQAFSPETPGAAQSSWGAPAGGQSSVPQAVWGQPAAGGSQAAWGSPPQAGSSAPVEGQPPSAAGDRAQAADVGAKEQAAWPGAESAAADAPASIGRNDETVLRPPHSVPPEPADDTVWRPPSA